MGSCMSKGSIIDEVSSPPPPHPQARRVWLVATVVDPQQIPSDLVGIEADGLKSAMRNRGLETEHWALKVDPPADVKASYTIFDITVEDNKLVSNIHPANSPYWKIIQRRAAIGWTIWTDQEIFEATKLLIMARPKYDGRTNNSQTSARLLGRHIDLAQEQQHAARSASETTAATSMSPTGSSILHKPGSLELDGASASINNQSQMSLASGAQSHVSQPMELELKEKEDDFSEAVSRMPASIRHSQRMSVARPPLIHLSTTPSVAGSEIGGTTRPTLVRSPETEHGTGSTGNGTVRLSLPPQPRQQSPLNPSHRKSVSELRTHGRSRTQSDAQMYNTMSAADARIRPSRRRSEAPAEWVSEIASSPTRSRRNTNRDSVLSLGAGSVAGGYGGSMLASPMATWGPSMMPPSPTMLGMPMGGYGMPQMPPMPMWPNGGMAASPSMTFNPAALQIPMPYFPHPNMGMPMPMLAPPSPGFYSHTSSAVPTPPESPQILSTHMSKSVPEFAQALAPPVRA